MQQFKYTLSRADGVSCRGRIKRTGLRVFRNDWSSLAPPEPGSWIPGLAVSVIIPARDGQEQVDLVLASLARQTYPKDLLEVVVVDDHSSVPLRLPDLRPIYCRIERAPASGWGGGHARAYGAHVTSGQILCWLDPDLVVAPGLIESLARWQHVYPEAVALGSVRYAANHRITPAQSVQLIESGELERLLADAAEHPWVERVLAHSDDLREADHLGFHAFVGSCTAVSRELYEAVGGMDPMLTLGYDTELGYRLWQAGGLFIPDRDARAWHLGPATVNRTRIPSARFRTRVLADLMPHPRAHRAREQQGIVRQTPLVRAVVDVTGARYELVRSCVDRLLAGSEQDLAVTLVADWDEAGDSCLEARLIQANYLVEPRVGFASVPPRTGFPAPYLLDVPVACGVGRDTVARLVARAEWAQAGLTELIRDSGTGLRLWRTRAVTRALRVREPGEKLEDAVAQGYGYYRIHGNADLTDLTNLSPVEAQRRPWRGVPEPRRETVPGPHPAVRDPLRRAVAATGPLRALLRRLRGRR